MLRQEIVGKTLLSVCVQYISARYVGPDGQPLTRRSYVPFVPTFPSREWNGLPQFISELKALDGRAWVVAKH